MSAIVAWAVVEVLRENDRVSFRVEPVGAHETPEEAAMAVKGCLLSSHTKKSAAVDERDRIALIAEVHEALPDEGPDKFRTVDQTAASKELRSSLDDI
jgi:hypothetical protein